MKKLRAFALTLIAVGTAIGCGDNSAGPVPPPPPPPGSAIVSMVTPNNDDGAVILTLTGPGLTTIQSSVSSNLFYSRLASAQEARVILVGNLSAGPLFTFKLADGTQLSAYTATVQQVAMRNDSLRTNIAAYNLAITAAP